MKCLASLLELVQDPCLLLPDPKRNFGPVVVVVDTAVVLAVGIAVVAVVQRIAVASDVVFVAAFAE